MKTETVTLETFCRAICKAFEGLPPEYSQKIWEAFEGFQGKGPPSNKDLRDTYEALVAGLTLNELLSPETETVTLENETEVLITETETEIVILAQDWGIEGAFGARLEIGTAFANRETVIKAFEAVCKVLDN